MPLIDRGKRGELVLDECEMRGKRGIPISLAEIVLLQHTDCRSVCDETMPKGTF